MSSRICVVKWPPWLVKGTIDVMPMQSQQTVLVVRSASVSVWSVGRVSPRAELGWMAGMVLSASSRMPDRSDPLHATVHAYTSPSMYPAIISGWVILKHWSCLMSAAFRLSGSYRWKMHWTFRGFTHCSVGVIVHCSEHSGQMDGYVRKFAQGVWQMEHSSGRPCPRALHSL